MGNSNQPVGGHASPIPGPGTNHAKVQMGRGGGGGGGGTKPTKYGDSHLPNI